jgi:hypothetical protein
MPWRWRDAVRPDNRPYDGRAQVRRPRVQHPENGKLVEHESLRQVQTLRLFGERTFFYVLPFSGLKTEDVPRILLALLLEMPEEFDLDLATEILKTLPRSH